MKSARDRLFEALGTRQHAPDPAEEAQQLRERLRATSVAGDPSHDEGGMEHPGSGTGAITGDTGSQERFARMAEASGAVVLRAASAADVPSVLVPHLRESERVVLAEHPLIDESGIARALMERENGCTVLSVTDASLQRDTDTWKRAYASADAGIDAGILGIADAGAVLLASSEYESRSVSLLPDVHVALLRASSLLPSLHAASDVLRRLITGSAGAEGASALTLVGGPSKTADIEKVLITGVHGPRVFIVVLIGDAADSRP